MLILVLILAYVLFMLENDDNEPMYHYSDIKKKLKTGDIILFSCKQHGSFFNRVEYSSRTNIVGSMYGHAGIIIRKKNGEVYIVEVCDYDQCGGEHAKHLNNYNQGGVRIIKLDIILNEYYKEYKGTYAVKFISKEIPYLEIMEKLKRYKHITFQPRKTLLFLAIVDIFISHSLANSLAKKCDQDKMICTEFLYNLLCDCNVLKNYPAKLFWPHLITNQVFDELENIKYSKPLKFIIDNDNYNQNN
jgi:hypothetical protein